MKERVLITFLFIAMFVVTAISCEIAYENKRLKKESTYYQGARDTFDFIKAIDDSNYALAKKILDTKIKRGLGFNDSGAITYVWINKDWLDRSKNK